LLIAAACGVFLWEPWHEPILLSVSSTHGIHAGDLPAVVLMALAVVIGRTGLRERLVGGPPSDHPRAGPVSTVVVGALLLVGLVDTTTVPPLLPAGGGTFGGVTDHADGQDPDPVDRWPGAMRSASMAAARWCECLPRHPLTWAQR
jgi:hypothetical protein